MTRYIIAGFAFLFLIGCGDNSISNNNPYLPNYSVNLSINLNLAQYSELKFITNGVYIPNEGVRGVVIFNIGNDRYNAFDAACPNQALSSCSTMQFKKLNVDDLIKIDETKVICDCDNAEYSLFSGQSVGKEFPLKQYRTELSANILKIYN